MIKDLSISWHDLSRFGHVWIYFLKWPLYFLAGWTAILYRRWRKSHDESAAQEWPSVDGLIISGKVTPLPKTSRSLATLEYTYFVGEYRSGKYVHEFSSEEDADTFVRSMKDKHIPIRYNQTNPNKSVLEEAALAQHIPLTPRFG